MHGGEPRLEEKYGGNDKGARRTGCQTMRGTGERKRANKAIGVGNLDACGFTELGVPPDEVVEFVQKIPNVASPLGLALDMFQGIGEVPFEVGSSGEDMRVYRRVVRW